MADDEEIGSVLAGFSLNLELAATQLVQLANDSGGRDNVSVILVRVAREFPVARGWADRWLGWLK
jgi:protein phosphatase